MAETSEELNELWLDLMDSIAELKNDVKGNRRVSRHVKNLEAIVNEIGHSMTQMTKKKGILR